MTKRYQLSVGTDLLSEMLMKTIMERTGIKKTELVRKMIFSYAQQTLTEEELNSVISSVVKSKLL